jgi:hypothetical protein
MRKTFKKSDINKYLDTKKTKLSEEKVNEFINPNGSLISPTNNYKQNRNFVKSKKTTDDYVRNSTQGPEAYFVYGGPYYGINYTKIVREEEDILDLDTNDELYDELNVVPTKKYSRDENDRKNREAKMMADKDISSHYLKKSDPVYDHLPSEKWRGYKLPYDTTLDIDVFESEESMKSLVDEIVMKNKTVNKGIVKRMKEVDLMIEPSSIPDISELKTNYEKPMIVRKINSLLDLINKENIKGTELTIVLNHLINNLDIYSIDDEHRQLIGDKIKYGDEKGK